MVLNRGGLLAAVYLLLCYLCTASKAMMFLGVDDTDAEGVDTDMDLPSGEVNTQGGVCDGVLQLACPKWNNQPNTLIERLECLVDQDMKLGFICLREGFQLATQDKSYQDECSQTIQKKCVDSNPSPAIMEEDDRRKKGFLFFRCFFEQVKENPDLKDKCPLNKDIWRRHFHRRHHHHHRHHDKDDDDDDDDHHHPHPHHHRNRTHTPHHKPSRSPRPRDDDDDDDDDYDDHHHRHHREDDRPFPPRHHDDHHGRPDDRDDRPFPPPPGHHDERHRRPEDDRRPYHPDPHDRDRTRPPHHGPTHPPHHGGEAFPQMMSMMQTPPREQQPMNNMNMPPCRMLWERAAEGDDRPLCHGHNRTAFRVVKIALFTVAFVVLAVAAVRRYRARQAAQQPAVVVVPQEVNSGKESLLAASTSSEKTGTPYVQMV